MKPTMDLNALQQSLGQDGARKEVIRQLRMFADSLESRRWPDLMDCKLCPAADLVSEIICTIEVTVSHPWPG